MVAVKELEKGRLGTGGALRAPQLQPATLEAKAFEVEQEILQPQAGPFSDGGRLGGLEVGHAEGRFVGPVFGKAGEAVDEP